MKLGDKTSLEKGSDRRTHRFFHGMHGMSCSCLNTMFAILFLGISSVSTNGQTSGEASAGSATSFAVSAAGPSFM